MCGEWAVRRFTYRSSAQLYVYFLELPQQSLLLGARRELAACVEIENGGDDRIGVIDQGHQLHVFAFDEALRDHRLPIDRDLVLCGKIDFDEARQATLQLLQSEKRPDAILAFNDIITYAAFDAIKACGLRIPDDVAIIGFTDGDSAAFVTPKLSAIMDQAHEQGFKSCELLLRHIGGDQHIYREIIPMILKIRESSEK